MLLVTTGTATSTEQHFRSARSVLQSSQVNRAANVVVTGCSALAACDDVVESLRSFVELQLRRPRPCGWSRRYYASTNGALRKHQYVRHRLLVGMARKSAPPRSVLFVGAGAVEGAWTPVIEGLRDVYGRAFPSSNPVANALLARLVWELRWLHSVRRSTRDKKLRASIDRQLKTKLARYRRVKSRISVQLRKAERQGAIKTRDALSGVIDQLVGSAHCVLTTNWDTTLESFLGANYKSCPPVIHLHGTAGDADSLYLPSEITEEPYRHWRTNRRFGGLAATAIKYIENCDRIVIYGLSFDPLDAELCAVVALAARKRVRKIVVVDLEPEVVADRLRALTGGKIEVEPRDVEHQGERIVTCSISNDTSGRRRRRQPDSNRSPQCSMMPCCSLSFGARSRYPESRPIGRRASLVQLEAAAIGRPSEHYSAA